MFLSWRLLSNYPVALAPGMGENFYFVFTVVLGMGNRLGNSIRRRFLFQA